MNGLKIEKARNMELQMDFQVETSENITVIVLKSEGLDSKNSSVFTQKVIDLINLNDLKFVVFDLKDLKFIESSGFSSFLKILRFLITKQGDLKLACMSEEVKAMFELVSMHKIFEIYNNTADAVSSF